MIKPKATCIDTLVSTVLDHNSKLYGLERALNGLSNGTMDLVTNVNKGYQEFSAKVAALEARIEELEKMQAAPVPLKDLSFKIEQ